MLLLNQYNTNLGGRIVIVIVLVMVISIVIVIVILKAIDTVRDLVTYHNDKQ